MKKSTKVILFALIAVMLLALPFAVPSGKMLSDYQYEWMDYAWNAEALLRLLVPSANAEEAVYSLPIDFTPGMTPNPAGYSEESYEDDSISVQLQKIEQDGTIWRVAYVQIKDASQLRTGIAGAKVTSSKTAFVSTMAKKQNAVLAISGDYYINDPNKTSFEYRMGTKIRNKTNKTKDILIIDENGDFHLFIKSAGADNFVSSTGHTIINAFTFGPALVMDGVELTVDKGYSYNPNEKEPRLAIGQMDTLSYVCVVAEGRMSTSAGATAQQMADFMYALGCKQAFCLDGGNTATMVFNGGFYMQKAQERDQSDIIYFASAVDPATWGN